tara:strand:- start:131 stop:565 length:435 start_codon:yes stop_codon:yes gene_type:complete
MTKLCARGKSAAKRKFKVYPSAYANAYASKICAGKIKDPSGTKRKDWGPKKAKVGMAITAGSQSAMGRLEKSGMTKAKKGKMMILIAIGKAKPKKANKGAIMEVANKLEKASKAHAGQARTLKSLKLSRGGGAAIRGTNFQGVF